MANRRRAAALAAWIGLAIPGAPGGEKPVALPPDLAKCLSAAQADLKNNRPQEAINRLKGFKGKDHALRHLLWGHAYAQQSDLPRAAAAYRQALAMDAALTQAGIGLAQVYTRQGTWSQAAALLGRYVASDSCKADVLLLYAQAARQSGDGRLCGLLVRKGVLRFPQDVRFRRLDLAVLLDAGDHPAASQAVLLLLDQAPTDGSVWQHLAFIRDRMGDRRTSLSALEASLLCDPTDLVRHRRFLAGQLSAGDWLTVVKHGQALLAGPLGRTASADTGLMELLIRAADLGEKDELLAAWLDRIDEKRRTRPMRLAAVRLALRRGETAQAREALSRLIQTGETDPSVFLWAGHLAETQEDWPAAETLYDQARKRKGRPARLATLYLARLHFGRGRLTQAAQLLRGYLDTYPEDAPARALLALVEARAAAPKDE